MRKQSLFTKWAGVPGPPREKEYGWTPSHTIDTSELQMDRGPKRKSQHGKSLTIKYREKS